MICSRVLFLRVWFSCCFLFVCERCLGWKKVCLGCSVLLLNVDCLYLGWTTCVVSG